jgi:release factor glutamine methyltransferase
MDYVIERPTSSPAHIASHCSLGGLDLTWDDRVLAPRAWTRLHSSWATELAASLEPGPLLELCCGVGHIGLLAVRDSGRAGALVDANPSACQHARRNARCAGLAGSVRVIEHRIDGGPVPWVPFDIPLVLADPPYLRTSDLDNHDMDPLSAVDGGDDGLELVQTVLRTAAFHLSPTGVCLLQVRGRRQADLVAHRLRGDWQDIGLVASDLREMDEDRAVQLLRPQGLR